MEKLNSTKDLAINYSIAIPSLSQSYLGSGFGNMSLSYLKEEVKEKRNERI